VLANIGLSVLRTLFVYGTLRSEFSNHFARLLHRQGELIGKASVAGSIYRIESYPGWMPESKGEVHGELYRLRDPESTLQELDDYEGEDFERVAIETQGPASEIAWIYRYKKNPPDNSRIASGDFCAP
jgi:gamma-glutamylcyclotransferase (GGCT)/AIG2-like uncharacterized protein YtfP